MPQDRFAYCTFLLLLVIVSVGCDDGSVVAKGKVLLEGEPLSCKHGQLVLSPVAKGPKAFGAIAADGSFQLRSADVKGAMPGKYSVIVKYQPEFTEKQKKQIQRAVEVDEVSVSHSSPKEQHLEIPETGSEELVIDIRRKEGWNQMVSD